MPQPEAMPTERREERYATRRRKVRYHRVKANELRSLHRNHSRLQPGDRDRERGSEGRNGRATQHGVTHV